MKTISEIYPNAPLIKVVCEVQFNGNLEIEAKKYIFQQTIQEQYTKLFVPKIEGMDQAVALEPFSFENADRSSGILLSINKFAYFEREYTGHENFIKEFLRLFEILKKIVDIQKINRVGWRYINLIPFTRSNENIPIQDFLNVSVNIPKVNMDAINNFSVVLVSNAGSGQITTKLEPVISNERSEAILLDFDFAEIENINSENIKDKIDRAHDYTRDLFESMITERYRQYLRGEEI